MSYTYKEGYGYNDRNYSDDFSEYSQYTPRMESQKKKVTRCKICGNPTVGGSIYCSVCDIEFNYEED